MRHRIRRMLSHNFNQHYFKPRGIPLHQLDEVKISDEELETLRLRYQEGKNQYQAAKSMKLSQSQYQRDLTKALEKITDALINGKAIAIEKKSN
jgi:predicted DNA-binding protein (UPF0251 family)